MVQQCRFFSSVEYASGQLDEVCFESLVGGYLWVDHREVSAKTAVGDACRLAGWDNSTSTEPGRRWGERAQDLPTKPVQGVGKFLG